MSSNYCNFDELNIFDFKLTMFFILNDEYLCQKPILFNTHTNFCRVARHDSRNAKDEDKDSYEDACKVLGEHFKSCLNKDAVILMFRQAMQKEGESLSTKLARKTSRTTC